MPTVDILTGQILSSRGCSRQPAVQQRGHPGVSVPHGRLAAVRSGCRNRGRAETRQSRHQSHHRLGPPADDAVAGGPGNRPRKRRSLSDKERFSTDRLGCGPPAGGRRPAFKILALARWTTCKAVANWLESMVLRILATNDCRFGLPLRRREDLASLNLSYSAESSTDPAVGRTYHIYLRGRICEFEQVCSPRWRCALCRRRRLLKTLTWA